MSNYPSDLKYSKDHSYIRLEGNIATFGLTHHGASQMGDIIGCVVLVNVGDKLAAEKIFGTIENVKAASDFFLPVGGTIEAINGELDVSPELINDDPYGEGWILKIRLDDPSTVENWLSASQYEEFVKQQE